jgi:mRNA interferase HigB
LRLINSQCANLILKGVYLHVISRKMLLQVAQEHSDLGPPLDAWYRIAKKAQWRSLEDVRKVLPTADSVGRFTVFNVKGNAFRLIVEINYRTGRLFVRHILTHAAYDRGGWKQ